MSNDSDISYIGRIEFNVFSNDKIKKYSSINDDNGIVLPESYDNSEPKRGGLVDTRLGTTDANILCAYCGLGNNLCPGHFGHTQFVAPLFHYGYFEKYVKGILDCICLRSSRLLLHKNPNELNKIVRQYNGRKRFMEIKKASSGITESDVGVPVPKIKVEKKKSTGAIYLVAETSISNVIKDDGDIEDKKVIKEDLDASDIYNIFRNITNIDFELLGFNPNMYRPEDLLILTFPVPPVAIRPSLRADFLASACYEDDLTHKLSDIIKHNEKFRHQSDKDLISGENSVYSEHLKYCLQYHVTTYFDNDKSAFLQSEQKVGNKKFKSISERIKHKKGRIRGNLMGKRTNFSARTVITSDPNLKLNELGIPKKIAMELTFPEIVTSNNIERLSTLVQNGKYKYPGANFIIIKDQSGNKKEYDLRYGKKTFKLRFGDVVERHLCNGDPVLFNRQPSLHKLSMMCHEVKVIDSDQYNTFRMNVNTTPPYNADFDGDEMNLFAPQSIQTQIELKMIADVNRMIISPKDSDTAIYPVQDSVLGSYNITAPNIKVNWRDFMNILVNCNDLDLENIRIEKGKVFTGTELYNTIIPKGININGNTTIIDGDIIKGRLYKKINTQIIKDSWDKYGDTTTANFITNIQKLIVNFNFYEGFSVGLKDCLITKETKKKIKIEVEKKKLEIAHLITEIENNPELLEPELFEESIKENLKAQKGEIQNLVMDDISDVNNFNIMIKSGAKGKPLNMMQIAGALGQDIFQQNRFQKDLNERTLPHFHANDDTPEARGYIQNSYLDGLSSHEFFFHTFSGREGMIDTAIKTAETGYISRKLMKGLEDIYLTYDGTVRTANNIITQYVYGDFNLKQTVQKLLKLQTMSLGNTEIKEKYCLSKKEIDVVKKKTKSTVDKISKINDGYYNELVKYRDMMRKVQRNINLNYKILITEFYLPANLPRLIKEIKHTVIDSDNDEFCSPEYILDQINYMMKPEVTHVFTFNKNQLEDHDSIKMNDERRCKQLFKYALLEFLSPKKVIFEYNFNKAKFDMLVNDIIQNFKKAQVEPGEMVGSVAAQHIGEPSTQMSTLGSTNINVCIVQKNNTSFTKIYKGEMGKFIDEYMVNNKDKTLSTGHKDSFETILDDNYDYYIVGVNKKEETSFNKISHVSRHPTNGDLMEIKTRSGRKVVSTYSHNHLIRTDEDVVPILGKDLKVGLRVPVAKEIKLDLPRIETVKIGDQVIELNELFGWFIGAYLAEGCINGNCIKITSIKKHFQENTKNLAKVFNAVAKVRVKKGEYGRSEDTDFSHKPLAYFLTEKCNKGSFLKVVPDFAYGAPEEFTKGLLRGYFDGDGNIQCDKLHHGFRACSRSEQLVKDLGLLYAYKGICVNFVTEKDKAGSDLYHYIIPYKYAEKYLNNIGSDDEIKLQKINGLVEYANRDNAHDKAEYIDKIPNLGNIIAKCGKDLKLEGQSRTYGRWKKKESIGRATLGKYIKVFENEDKEKIIQREINILKQAYNNNVIWDEIVEIKNIDDPKEYVYDFTVPGNQTFLTGDGIIVHNTLNTFHATGSGSKAMQGVPRVEELTRATKNIKTPEMNIYIKEEFRKDRDKANVLASSIMYTTISDVIEGYEVIYDLNTKDDGGYTKFDKASNPFYISVKSSNKNYELMPWLLRIKLDRNKMIENNVTTLEIKTSYIKFFRSYLSDIKSLKRLDKQILSNISGTSILSNFDNSDEPIIHIRFELSEFNYDSLLNMNQWILDNFKLKGMDNIKNINIASNSRLIDYDKDSKIVEDTENVIFTDGINMEEIRYLPDIDLNRTYCNEINTINKYFGIEAARASLLKEITAVYSDYSLNNHHLTILTDAMTNMGVFTSIDRHGINKLDTDPLSRASFEMPIEQLIKAAVHNEVDTMKSVSSRVMAGRTIKGGTGLCDLLLDTDFVMNSEYIEDEDALQKTAFNLIEPNEIILDILKRTKFRIFRPKK